MVVTPEVRVARVEQEGRQLQMSLFRGNGLEHVTVRLLGEHVLEVWIGDHVCVNERGSQEPLTAREDVYGAIARKAREFVLLLNLPHVQRVAVVDLPAPSPRRLGEILQETYPELTDIDPYPEAADATAE